MEEALVNESAPSEAIVNQTEEPNSTPYLNSFLNTEYGIIGRTASTRSEPNTSSKFHFWIANREEARLKLEIGNIIAVISDDNDEVTFGIVIEMRSYSDIDSFLADYLSHNFGEADTQVPTDISEVVVVTCDVMRNISGTTKPVGRSRAFFPTEQGIRFAYGIVDERGNYIFSGAAIPVGIFENGDGTVAPISIDEDYLTGPDGAHLNISGISGLAAKTSALEFVLKSLLTHTGKRIAVVMFNVKSKDLLYVEQSNPRAIEDHWSVRAYEALEVPIEPFNEAQFFAPADPQNPSGTQSRRQLPTNRFHWDLQMIYQDIPSLFSQLDWDDKMEGVWFVIREEIRIGNILTYADMLQWTNRLIDDANRRNNQYPRGNHIATWNKMRMHLRRFPRSFHGLISSVGSGQDISWDNLSNGSVFIIDIEMLSDRGKRLVFGRSIRAIGNILESEDAEIDNAVVFVDELNKFAPSGMVRTPLKSRLIDITARGRSIGLVLFGAEQFASDVEKEVFENSSTFLFGRTESTELRTPTYSVLSNEVKTKLSMLPQGQLLVKFPKFPQPIFVKFPYPPCLPGDQFDLDSYRAVQGSSS
ncbi:ATP-binding protein [Candidatus Neomarinimicrobiota bacterium]